MGPIGLLGHSQRGVYEERIYSELTTNQGRTGTGLRMLAERLAGLLLGRGGGGSRYI